MHAVVMESKAAQSGLLYSKLNDTCTSRIMSTSFVMVTLYIAGHTGHELGVCELPHLSLPASVKDAVAITLSLGIPVYRQVLVSDCTIDNLCNYCVITASFIIIMYVYRHSTRCREPHKKERLPKYMRHTGKSTRQACDPPPRRCPVSVPCCCSTTARAFQPCHGLQSAGLKKSTISYATRRCIPPGTADRVSEGRKYAGCVLCIDSTYGTNAYRYKLITCIVPGLHKLEHTDGSVESHYQSLGFDSLHEVVNAPPND